MLIGYFYLICGLVTEPQILVKVSCKRNYLFYSLGYIIKILWGFNVISYILKTFPLDCVHKLMPVFLVKKFWDKIKSVPILLITCLQCTAFQEYIPQSSGPPTLLYNWSTQSISHKCRFFNCSPGNSDSVGLAICISKKPPSASEADGLCQWACYPRCLLWLSSWNPSTFVVTFPGTWWCYT